MKLDYPKLPGNVANACTFGYPVCYEVVDFEIEQLFAGDPAIKQMIIEAAKKLEAQGVRAIIGACGYFAHFQKDVAAAVDVPVFMSSLCQLPVIKAGFAQAGSIAVFAADGSSLNDDLLAQVGSNTERLIIQNVGDMEASLLFVGADTSLTMASSPTIYAAWRRTCASSIPTSRPSCLSAATCLLTRWPFRKRQVCRCLTLLRLQTGLPARVAENLYRVVLAGEGGALCFRFVFPRR